MKQIPNFSAFERISSSMAKTFGKVKKGKEEDFALELASIEGNLLKTYRMNKVHNGRRASEAIKICLFIIDGYFSFTEEFMGHMIPDNEKMDFAVMTHTTLI